MVTWDSIPPPVALFSLERRYSYQVPRLYIAWWFVRGFILFFDEMLQLGFVATNYRSSRKMRKV